MPDYPPPPDGLSFLEFLQTHRRGELLSDAEDARAELIEAVRRFGGKGKLTIELDFETNKAGQMECQPSVNIKKPRRVLGVGIYYATDDGRLTRRDPNQSDMIDELEARRGRDVN